MSHVSACADFKYTMVIYTDILKHPVHSNNPFSYEVILGSSAT